MDLPISPNNFVNFVFHVLHVLGAYTNLESLYIPSELNILPL